LAAAKRAATKRAAAKRAATKPSVAAAWPDGRWTFRRRRAPRAVATQHPITQQRGHKTHAQLLFEFKKFLMRTKLASIMHNLHKTKRAVDGTPPPLPTEPPVTAPPLPTAPPVKLVKIKVVTKVVKEVEELTGELQSQSAACGPVHVPRGGYKVSYTTSKVGGSVTLACQVGYDLVGSTKRECVTDGRKGRRGRYYYAWSGTVTSCIPSLNAVSIQSEEALAESEHEHALIPAASSHSPKWQPDLPFSGGATDGRLPLPTKKDAHSHKHSLYDNVHPDALTDPAEPADWQVLDAPPNFAPDETAAVEESEHGAHALSPQERIEAAHRARVIAAAKKAAAAD
jgi:hypothetical protein